MSFLLHQNGRVHACDQNITASTVGYRNRAVLMFKDVYSLHKNDVIIQLLLSENGLN